MELAEIFRSQGWDIRFSRKHLIVDAPSQAQARLCVQSQAEILALWAKQFGCKAMLVTYPRCVKPYRIPAKPEFYQPANHIFQGETMQETGTVISAIRNGRPDLRDATRRQVIDFIESQRENGKIVVVTSNTTNKCLDVTDLDPERGIFAYTSQWHGLNFLELWRESMDQYYQLLNLLNSDGYIPGFTYELLRIDGSKGRYCKDYYLSRNLLTNEDVRISVSDKHTNSWELIRLALV